MKNIFPICLICALLLTCMSACKHNIAQNDPTPTVVKEQSPQLKLLFFNQMAWIKEQYTSATSHGDCTFVELPNGERILIDTSTAYSTPFIVQILKDMGVTKIDYFICTHLHQDHTDGILSFAKEFQIKKVIWSGYGEGFPNARHTLRTAIDLYNMEEILVRAGDEMTIGDVKLEFLWPTKDAPNKGLTEETKKAMLNPYSMVFRMSYGDFSALFTADITTAVEPEIVSLYGDGLRSTVLKIAHHGLGTSSSDGFIEAVKPKLAVCMGRGVQYDNNNNNVQIRFTKRLIPVYGTFSDGQILIETDGKTCTVTAEYKGTAAYSLSNEESKPET